MYMFRVTFKKLKKAVWYIKLSLYAGFREGPDHKGLVYAALPAFLQEEVSTAQIRDLLVT